MTVKGSDHRTAAHLIDPIFLNRWSPRAMSGEPIAEDELMLLFEAARWAPSSMNFQPWRMLYARRDTPHWTTFYDLLNENNRKWAHQAAALIVFISRTTFDDGRPCVTHAFDTGAAWQNFALQASERQLVAHGMQGFDYEKARSVLGIPAHFSVDAMVAVGRHGDRQALPEPLRSREQPSTRRPLSDTVRAGPFQSLT